MANEFSGLVDAHGQPIKKQTIVKEQATPTVGGVRKVWTDSVAAGMTPQKLASMLKASRGGDNAEFLRFAEEMEERDPHYASVMNTRKLAVVGLKPQIEAASDDPRDIEIAGAVRALIKTRGFRSMKYDALDGLGKGYSVVEIDWQATAAAWKPMGYTWRDPAHFQWGIDGRELRLRQDGNKDGIELTPGRYMIHVPQLKSGLPARNGLARLAAWCFCLKSFSLKDWAQFAETYGMPLRIGKYDSNEASKADKLALLRALRMMAHDFAAIIPENMDVELVQASSGRGGEGVFGGLAKYIDEAFSKAVLGQTMTTDNGSSQAQAKVHNDVRLDIVQADATQLAETIQNNIIIPFVNFNYGVQEAYPEYTLPAEAAEDLSALATVISTLSNVGLTFQASEVRDRFGFSDPQQGAELIGGLNMPEADEGEDGRAANRRAKCPGCGKVHNRIGDRQEEDDLDQLGADALEQWSEQIDPLLDPIRKAANSVSSYEEFIALLPTAASQGDIDRLASAMGKALFLALGSGDGAE